MRRAVCPQAQGLASAVALLLILRTRCDCSVADGHAAMLQHTSSVSAADILGAEAGLNPNVAAADDCNVGKFGASTTFPYGVFVGSYSHQSQFCSTSGCRDARHVEPDSSNGACDTRQNTSHAKRVAVLLRGGSWRRRRSDGQESDQDSITRSQVEMLVQPLERAGYEVDVYMVTNPNPTRHNSSFWTGHFGTRLKSFRELEPTEGNYQGRHVAAVLDLAQSAIAQFDLSYRFIVMLRNDLMLKQGDFVKRILSDARIDSTFLFPFKTQDAGWSDPTGHPDTLQIFPHRLLQCYAGTLLCKSGSEQWCSFSREFLYYNMRCRLGRTKVGFLYSIKADPDAGKCWNPIYVQPDRAQSKKRC